MVTDLSFKRLSCNDRKKVEVIVEGKKITVMQGDSVALAAMYAGVRPTRTTTISGAGRAPYCMMGVCFECLMTVDGKANVQTCLTEVKEGMVISIQHGIQNTDEDSYE